MKTLRWTLVLALFALAQNALANFHILDASYDRESRSVKLEIGCGSGYELELFNLEFEPPKIPLQEVTAALVYKGNEGTLKQGACEATLTFDMSTIGFTLVTKPAWVTFVNRDRTSSKRLLIL